jgi:hypothetical protein
MKPGICEKACEILAATRDGDDLLSWQLRLVENAVNSRLNERGWRLFEGLMDRVRAGTYRDWTVERAMADVLRDT